MGHRMRSFFKIAFRLFPNRFTFSIYNRTDLPTKLDWNAVSYIDPQGRARKVVHSLHVGRQHAETAFHRPRHAPGISDPRRPSHHHHAHPGHTRKVRGRAPARIVGHRHIYGPIHPASSFNGTPDNRFTRAAFIRACSLYAASSCAMPSARTLEMQFLSASVRPGRGSQVR